jgi:hypothetical protein
MTVGAVPKDFAQDIVVVVKVIGQDAPVEKTPSRHRDRCPRRNPVQSTLEEAPSKGKIDIAFERMV